MQTMYSGAPFLDGEHKENKSLPFRTMEKIRISEPLQKLYGSNNK